MTFEQIVASNSFSVPHLLVINEHGFLHNCRSSGRCELRARAWVTDMLTKKFNHCHPKVQLHFLLVFCTGVCWKCDLKFVQHWPSHLSHHEKQQKINSCSRPVCRGGCQCVTCWTARQTPSEMIPNTTIFNRMHFSLLNERENSSFSSLSAYSINQRE